jgi:hypothetical protein
LQKLSQKYWTQGWDVGVAHKIQHLPSKCEDLDSNPSTTKNEERWPYRAEKVGLEPTMLSVSWDSVLNILNVYSSTFQTVLRIKTWDAHCCWAIHLSLAMSGKNSTALNIELALDESLTPFKTRICHSEPFHHLSVENCVCGDSQVKFPPFVGSSHSLPQSEPWWAVSEQRQWSLSLKMTTTFSSCSVGTTGCILEQLPFCFFFRIFFLWNCSLLKQLGIFCALCL